MNLLLEHGHANARKYTPGQINLFLAAIWRQERRDYRERVLAHRIALSNEDSYAKAMRKLSRTDE